MAGQNERGRKKFKSEREREREEETPDHISALSALGRVLACTLSEMGGN